MKKKQHAKPLVAKGDYKRSTIPGTAETPKPYKECPNCGSEEITVLKRIPIGKLTAKAVRKTGVSK